MVVIYLLIIKTYGLLIWTASAFNAKANQWRKGRIDLLKNIKQTLKNNNENRIWFHCSSLGEFEQGKPVIEAVRKEFPDHKIVLTFFSPSGYEQKKNDPLVDYVFYLPLDGPLNSKRFIDLIKPTAAFFVKYEFWHFYIYYLRQQKIPCYYFSCLFRPSQTFFQFYGRFSKNMLQRITHIFVQNQDSLVLLYKNSISNVTVSGDTRFDRVYENSLSTKKFPDVEQFIQNKKVLVAGSTWQADERILSELINQTGDYKFIIVPHQINNVKIQSLISSIKKKSIRYSQLKTENANDADVLIIDNVGMLSSLYQYATITYIGGGFGAGIHNTLEAAVFGKPLIFGPRYQQFQEAIDLIKSNGAFSISDFSGLNYHFDALNKDQDEFAKINSINRKYVEDKRGATEVIMNYIRMNW
ncbi:MAG: glycosyltransferase N-terminal domain-containing protein [Bacteroidia bacterium]